MPLSIQLPANGMCRVAIRYSTQKIDLISSLDICKISVTREKYSLLLNHNSLMSLFSALPPPPYIHLRTTAFKDEGQEE